MNHYYSEDCRLLNFFRTATIVLVAIWGLFGLGVLGFSILKKQYDVLRKNMIPFWIMLMLKILSNIMFIVYLNQCPWIFAPNTTPIIMSFVIYYLCNAYIPSLISVLIFSWIITPSLNKLNLIYFIVIFCIYIGFFVAYNFF